MADERDPQISQRYRALGREEPPPELDRAILAAARRASRRHRWYASLAAAAVLIFAVAIVVQIERQPPDQMPVSAPSTSTAAQPARDKIAPQRRAAPQFTPEPPPAPADAQRNRTDEPHAAETRAAPQPQ